jgi:hypothetical protein
MWAAHCRESPATSPNRDGEAAQVPRVFSLSPTNQAGELIDAFLVTLKGENSTPFCLLTSVTKIMAAASLASRLA